MAAISVHTEAPSAGRSAPTSSHSHSPRYQRSSASALGCPRFFLAGSNHVYVVFSSRARGLAVGVNLNPDRFCNFDCCYCEVDRNALVKADQPVPVNAQAVASELSNALHQMRSGTLLQHPYFSQLPPDMLRLAHVTISGDGEPTMCPNFSEVVEGVVHLRAASLTPYFKLVLLTNGSGLDRPTVRSGLRLFTHADELWVKLDAGTAEGMERINRPAVAFEKILHNILEVGRLRPIVIQSMFVEVDGVLPDRASLVELARRLTELKEAGARIGLVQVYSATRPNHSRRCRHLSLRVLSDIAGTIHQMTGLRVEVF